MRQPSKLLSLLMIIFVPLFFGCEGPEGPTGPQGPEGPEGPVGPAGEDGSMIYSGQGAPDASIGDVGDYYLNTDTGEFYGPKDEGGWGDPTIVLKGEDGEDGSQIFSGSGAPDASLGSIGDYYLDKDNYDLYGPKNDSGWGTPINLKGTANVIYSAWTTFDSAVRDTTIDSSDLKVGDIDAPQITQEILDEGVVNVYMDFSGDVYPLPYTSYAGGAANTIDFLPRLNLIHVTRFTHDNSASVGFASSLEFRYVLIPGGVAAKSKLSKEEIKKMPYLEAQKRFGIQD